MAFEPRWQPIFGGFAQPLVGGDEAREQRHHIRFRPVMIRFATAPASAAARATQDF